MTVGKIIFGPMPTKAEERSWFDRDGGAYTYTKGGTGEMHACNCVGPQAGQTKCPCRLRAESEQGRSMIRDGVTIDGVEYELVRKNRGRGL